MTVSSHTNGTVQVRPKVLIPEKVSADGLSLLQSSVEVHERKNLSPEDLISIIGDYEALIVRSETKVTSEVLKAGKNLKVVARAGVGVDNVDVTAATSLGIIVVNSPVGNINAAAEHTIACEYDDRGHVFSRTDCATRSAHGSVSQSWSGVRKSQGGKVGKKQIGGC